MSKESVNRQKEERQNELCKNPDKNYSREISQLISYTIRKGNKVYLCGDWHLWVKDKNNPSRCYKRSNFDEVIKNVSKTVGKDDLLIHMGDLVDGEFKDRDSLKNVLLALPGNKVLVRGNNDIFEYVFYRSCGFRYVTRSFEWSDILFTHFPVKNDNQLNIHAHIHGYKTYWIPYTNQIDVAFLGGREKPVELTSIMKSRPRYSKLIKEEPKHFNESMTLSMFDSVMDQYGYIPDPYED